MRTVLLRSGEYTRDRHLALATQADLAFDSIAEFGVITLLLEHGMPQGVKFAYAVLTGADRAA